MCFWCSALFSAHDSDSDLASMPEDTEFNHFSDKDGLNSRPLTNGKVKIPLGTKEIEMPQLKPPPPNPPLRDSELKPSLTKDGRLQKKRGPKPGPRSSSTNKRQRLTSSRPVPKTALKNLKVGTVEDDSSLNGKESCSKVSYYCFSGVIHWKGRLLSGAQISNLQAPTVSVSETKINFCL